MRAWARDLFGHAEPPSPDGASAAAPQAVQPDAAEHRLPDAAEHRLPDAAEHRLPDAAERRLPDAHQLESHLQVLWRSPHPLAAEFLRAVAELARVAASLVTEAQPCSSRPCPPLPGTEQLRAGRHSLPPEPLARDARLELQGLEPERSQPATTAPSAPSLGPSRAPQQKPFGTAFPVRVRTVGKTCGCERQFLQDLRHHLARRGVFLLLGDAEGSPDAFLLVFCPITSRVGSDIDNALEGLGGVGNSLLVVLHHRPKDSARSCVDTKRRVQHRALVASVHAFFTARDGLYPCQENDAAVEATAAAMQDHLRAGGSPQGNESAALRPGGQLPP